MRIICGLSAMVLVLACNVFAQDVPESIWGMQSLTVKQAEALAQRNGTLSFGSLRELSDEAAKALAQHKGDILLKSVAELSDKAALSLSKHKVGFLELDRVAVLSDVAAEALAHHPGVSAHHRHRPRGADGGDPGLISPSGQRVAGLA